MQETIGNVKRGEFRGRLHRQLGGGGVLGAAKLLTHVGVDPATVNCNDPTRRQRHTHLQQLLTILVRSGLDQLRAKRLYCFFPYTCCCLKPSQGQDAGAKRPQHLLPIPDQQRHRSNGNPAQLPVRPRRTTFQVHPDQNGTKNVDGIHGRREVARAKPNAHIEFRNSVAVELLLNEQQPPRTRLLPLIASPSASS